MTRIASIVTFASLLLTQTGRGGVVDEQTRQYAAEVPKTIIELQQFRETSPIGIRSRTGAQGIATLINLNSRINVWYVLRLSWKGGLEDSVWHLENPKPRTAHVLLDRAFPFGLVVTEDKNRYTCDLWGKDSSKALKQGRGSGLIYYPLCGARLYLRNPAIGHRTALEAAAEFLRNQVWRGEDVVDLFHHLMAERYRETGEVQNRKQAGSGGIEQGNGYPIGAALDPQCANRLLMPSNLGITLSQRNPEKNGVIPGAWYAAAGNPGIYVSVLQPDFIDSAILKSYRTVVNSLDRVEASSLCYLIAFDLGRYKVGYALGTEHPGVGWSERVTGAVRDPHLPGPDGIGNIAPLVSTGLIQPNAARRTVATFAAGFKRTHGAFRYGELALRNHGSHYGSIENGVVFSKLQPGLATIFVRNDGFVDMKKWTDADNGALEQIRYARQNGVPLIEFDAASGASVPGPLVARWGAGNWSGSEDKKLRTLRAGIALQESHSKRFLIYAVFSDATPSAMARVFQAYRCRYAMHLDMNALEHTYLAVYRRSASGLAIDHLLKGMSQLDRSVAGQIVPRFLGYSDNRDFFYVMVRDGKESRP